MRKKKRRALTLGLTVFMIVSTLCTNVVHATGIEDVPVDVAEEIIIEEDVSENSSENVSEEVEILGETEEIASEEVDEEETISEEQTEETVTSEEEVTTDTEELLGEVSEEASEELSEEDVVEEEAVEAETMEETEETSIETESVWVTENLQIKHSIVNVWDGGYQGEVLISNLGETTIEDWNLMFEMDVEITQIWNASIASSENDVYIIQNNNWNANINAGESVSFGYIAAYEDTIVFPESYGISGAEEELTVDNYEITYEITDMWEDGYVASLTIINLSATELRNWKISFDLQDSICDLWNGVIHTNENGNYVIHCADYNSVIKTGESVTIGFRVQDDELQMYPENYAVKVIVHSTMRTDMRDDVIGIAYFEDLKAEDYRIEDDGIQYVANQLNLVGKDGVTFEQIARLGEEYEFEIVGYIELTNDYQVKFVVDKTYDELNALIEELGQNELILEAELNLVIVQEACYEFEDPIKKPNDELWRKKWDGVIGQSNWGMEAINALAAWQYEDYMTTVKIGLYDSGFDEHHNDLSFADTWNNPDSVDKELADHGTVVAGVMAATHNDIGVAGVVPRHELYGYACEPMYEDISKKAQTSSMEYKYAFALLIGHGARVVNVSYNTGRHIGFAASKEVDTALNYINRSAETMDNFLQRLLARGYDFVIVVAAGNSNNLYFIADEDSEYGYYQYEDDDMENLPSEAQSGGAFAIYNNFLSSCVKTSNRIIVVGAYELLPDGTFKYADFSCIGDRVDIMAPGVGIMSTGPDNGYLAYQKGTSVAAPHVSGVAALAYSVNPDLSGVQVKELIVKYHNEIVAYEKDETEAYEKEGIAHYSVDAERVVKQALLMHGNTPVLGENTGYIMGRIKDAKEGNEMEGVGISAYCISSYDGNIQLPGEYQYTTQTDANGEFTLELNPGTYRIMLQYPGYKPLIIEEREVLPNSIEYLEETMLVDNSIFRNISINGKVVNALNGIAVSCVEIKIREGWNAYTGNTVKEGIYTDSNGEYSVKLPIGYYTLEVKKEGFVVGYSNIVVYSGVETQVTVICPELKENEMRVVLTWGDKPSDLDSHLSLKYNDGETAHIFYANSVYYEQYSDRVYNLDIDDTTQYGPETMTFYTDSPEVDEYKYYVYNYSGGISGEELSYSGARVTVYYGLQKPKEYYVPFAQSGRTWNVFSVIDGEVVVNNTISQ